MPFSLSRRAEVRALQAELARSHAQVLELGQENRKLIFAAGIARSRETETQSALQRQTALLMMVAHELRNPLTPLLAAHMLDGARGDDGTLSRVRDAHAVDEDGAGLGIGLAVVQQLVKAHEGTVVARSPGKNLGSEFVVTLQAHASGPAP